MQNPTTPAHPHVHPLRRLLGYARGYRRDMVLATVYSVLNKFFDVLPELLIASRWTWSSTGRPRSSRAWASPIRSSS